MPIRSSTSPWSRDPATINASSTAAASDASSDRLFCEITRQDTPMRVDPDLMSRLDVAAPRYASYPTLADWNGGFEEPAWRTHLNALAQTTAPLALYVHLPFCASRCFYCGCNATVTTRAEVVDRYLSRLDHELAMVSESIGARPYVSEMHWGGGTPNFLDGSQRDRLITMLERRFRMDSNTERSLEADPRLVTRDQLEHLRDLGFSRISFGVQDTDPQVQASIGRVQPLEMVRHVVQAARDVGFRSINLDLLYGLPHQTATTFHETITHAIAMTPDRIACFGYAHVPWMRAHQWRMDEAALPDARTRFSLFAMAVQHLQAAGFQWIGMDHFARPDDVLSRAAVAGTLQRNFMGYTTRVGENLLGLGVSAISEIDGWYAQNTPELGNWQREIDAGMLSLARRHVMSDEDRSHERAIAHLMCNAELPFNLFFGSMEELLTLFAPFVSDGLVQLETDRFTVTPTGQFFLRNLCVTLDAYRAESRGGSRFSRSV